VQPGRPARAKKLTTAFLDAEVLSSAKAVVKSSYTEKSLKPEIPE
jgi:hypothetical protein